MVTFTSIDSIADARRVLRNYLVHADGKLSEATYAKLEELNDSPSPVDQICRSAELLYAKKDELDDTGRIVVAQLASFAANNAFHGMSVDNRGGRISLAMRRDAKVKLADGQPPYPEADTDPAADRAFAQEPDPVPTPLAPPPADPAPADPAPAEGE